VQDEWETIVRQITNSQYTRLPVFRDNIDHVIGFIHLRKVLPLLKQNKLDEKMIHPQSDAVIWGADFAYNMGGFISPKMFRDMFFAANKARVDNVKKKYGKHVVKHCCGNVNEFLDLFVELGYDCYQSIQQSGGMDLADVKRRIGQKMVLWGGVPVELIIDGSMDEVRREIKTAMDNAKDHGRFILGTTHTIAVGSNYDNFMAMVDEYWKHCEY